QHHAQGTAPAGPPGPRRHECPGQYQARAFADRAAPGRHGQRSQARPRAGRQQASGARARAGRAGARRPDLLRRRPAGGVQGAGVELMGRPSPRASSAHPEGFHETLRARLRSVDIDAKRRPGTEVGMEAWYPYYAGYTEEFAAQVIKASSLSPKSTVLDPWNGCGTTTRVADAQGHTAIGIDINPVATLVASAKLARAQDAIHVTGLAGRLAAGGLRAPATLTGGDPLRKWLCPALSGTYRSIERGILADLAVRDGVMLSPCTQALPPLAAFLLIALQRAARHFAGIKTTSN